MRKSVDHDDSIGMTWVRGIAPNRAMPIFCTVLDQVSLLIGLGAIHHEKERFVDRYYPFRLSMSSLYRRNGWSAVAGMAVFGTTREPIKTWRAP